MQQTNNRKDYDVIIIGAGPAGCACALSLKDTGLRVALFDKQDFPRDKVCGDAIPGRTFKVLGEIVPGYKDAFKQFPKKYLIRKTQLNYNGKMLQHSWVREAYTCARIDFDHFMFSLVKETQSADIFTGLTIKEIALKHDGVSVGDGINGHCYTAKVIIGADGAYSVVAKELTNRKMDRRHYVASVRAYYKNVLYTEDDKTEIFLHKKFFPGYFWVFPLPGNLVNAGFGMLSSEVASKKLNVKDAFYEFIRSPALSKRFERAQQAGNLEGHGLPLGSRRVPISGERFLLAGDAASLIDPISGDGIGNAVLSGKLAADQIVRSFGKNDFSAPEMAQYETTLFKVLGKELKRNARIAHYCSKMPFLLDMAFMIGKSA